MHFSTIVLAFGASAGFTVSQKCEHQWTGAFSEEEIGVVLQTRQNAPPPPLEIRPLIVSGDSANRVDLIFFGDGYTEEEKDKFFEDAMFQATNLTDGQTFADVLPVMNWWAGFSPSAESGVGVGGEPLDTVYGLYRDGTELRGVYYDKPEVGHAACDSTDKCDFPILLGNDPFYGGLGGTFTVVTASVANGPAVLRHELGHSIIGVGEEYDGGQVYRGVNSAPSADNVGWSHWYTDPESEPHIQRSNMPIQAYPWTLLNATEAWSQEFTSAGTYDSYLLQFSISGVQSSDDIRVELDGKDLGWEVNPVVGLDRWIYNMKFDSGLAAGTHELKYTLLNSDIEGTAQLCNLEVVEYGQNPEEFTFETAYHGAFPTWDIANRTTYRPTNDFCLMRTMHSPDFCNACIEGLWWALLEPLSLIDNITQTVSSDSQTEVSLELLPLAQFRDQPRDTEAYVITWYDANNNTLDEFKNKTKASFDQEITEGSVLVEFLTDQVRIDPRGVMTARESFEVEKSQSSK